MVALRLKQCLEFDWTSKLTLERMSLGRTRPEADYRHSFRWCVPLCAAIKHARPGGAACNFSHPDLRNMSSRQVGLQRGLNAVLHESAWRATCQVCFDGPPTAGGIFPGFPEDQGTNAPSFPHCKELSERTARQSSPSLRNG